MQVEVSAEVEAAAKAHDLKTMEKKRLKLQSETAEIMRQIVSLDRESRSLGDRVATGERAVPLVTSRHI